MLIEDTARVEFFEENAVGRYAPPGQGLVLFADYV
jgi:hypothetical protein